MNFRESVIALCRGFGVEFKAVGKAAKAGRREQKLGEYCQGKDVEECRAAFGESLPLICSTCPN